MHVFSSRLVRSLAALAVVLVVLALPSPPSATAAPAPWTWVRVVEPVSVTPHSYYSIRAICPSGYTAVTGGLSLPFGSHLFRNAEYRMDDVSGSGWFVSFENSSDFSGSASVVAECVRTADLPPISYNLVEITSSDTGRAEGAVSCLNPGEVVLSGGVDWSNVNTRQISHSGPAWSETQWVAEGSNSVPGAKLAIEVYCVDPAAVPGFEKLEVDYSQAGNGQHTLTCPVGKRILNGGSQDHSGGVVYGSAPNLNKWNFQTYEFYASWTVYLRAICVNAGLPTVSIQSASPADGSTSNQDYAQFQMSGTDPAGFPNSFKCSLNGSVPSACGSTRGYGPLATGDYDFVVYNQTADGRTSNLASVNWTVDVTAPAVTAPSLKPVSLRQGYRVTWTGTDQHSGVDHYEAAYFLAHSNGTSDGWTQPAGWDGLTEAGVELPALSRGDTLCLSVRAEDIAHNRSAWTKPKCTSRPFDDRAMTANIGWSRDTGSAYWQQTVTSTTESGRTLKRAGVTSRRVGIVASTCPGCGVVVVKVGTTTIGSIDLKTDTTKHQQILLLPGFSRVTGTVTVRSVSSGKKIRIDALVGIQRTTGAPVLP